MHIQVWDCMANGTRMGGAMLEFAASRVTVGDLVAARVRHEVARFNENLPEVFEGLVQPEESEQLLNGFRMSRRKEVDAERQIARAKDSFERNGFLVLANGKQVESWDEIVDVSSGLELEFLKIVPLVGG